MRRFRKLFGWVTITSLGVAALVFGLLAAVLDHQERTAGFSLGDFLQNFYRGSGSELVSIGFTVLILDRLYRIRENRDRKIKLLKALAGRDRDAARVALETLRTEGWLKDGTLQGASLREARLDGVDLEGADLRRVDLTAADLTRASLANAKLGGADLTRTTLRNSTLTGADLSGARLPDADLTGADMRRSVVDDAQLAQARALLDARLPDGEPYAGGYDLAGDRQAAQRLAYDVADATAMARFYAVSLDSYRAGRLAAR